MMKNTKKETIHKLKKLDSHQVYMILKLIDMFHNLNKQTEKMRLLERNITDS